MTAFPLRALEAQMSKCVAVTTEEIETEGNLKGQYVFRDEDGEKFMWSPRPIRYEFHNVDTVAEADDLMFLCPKCFEKNGGAAHPSKVATGMGSSGRTESRRATRGEAMKRRTNVFAFPLDRVSHTKNPGVSQPEPAVVIIFPVIKIEPVPDRPTRRRRSGRDEPFVDPRFTDA